MALSRRTGQRFQGSIWPGFVDAMTGLLLVLMFVLTMFMVMQFVLRETITGQESELDDLGQEIAALAQALGLERDRSERLENDLGTLNATLDDATTRAEAQSALIASLQQERADQDSALSAAQAQITSFEAQVASLLSQREDALGNVAALEQAQAELLSEKEALDLALATARSEIDEQVEAARLAAAQREAMDALIADLRAKGEDKDAVISARALELAELQEALSAEEKARLLEAEAAKALRARLETADAELTAMTLTLEAERKAAEDTLTLLAAARSASGDLTAQLAAAVSSGQDTDAAKAAVEKELAQVLTQLAMARSDLDAAREKQELTEVSKLTAEEEAAERIAALRAAQAVAEALLAETNANLETVTATSTQTNSALTSAEGQLAETRAQLSQTTRQLSRAEAELAEIVLVQEKSAEIIAALTSELARTRDDLAQAEANLTVAMDDSEIEQTLAAALAARTSVELEREEIQRQLAAALAAKLAAEQQAETRLDDATQQAILLAAARDELVQEQERTSQAQLQTEALNQQVAALRAQLSSLQAILDEAKIQDDASQVQLQNLGSELNAALARVAAEERKRRELEEAERKRLEVEALALQEQTKDLERYRSEFFGRLRDVLGRQDGVRIEGDRFVFSSEVLFPPGRAALSPEGRGEVAKVASILLAVADDIPDGIDWIIRVDGHTDNVPLSGLGEFADNWELSQARALSVVKYMVNFLGIQPTRLAANGFGQFQPVNLEDSDEARAQNRRIELKFTEK
ncbi:MAG: peptidoglycan -binding protein [Rhodobacteraceae bacterium]|jgi:chemotaxis protein MotB|uniref:peptidoglycan -binding protein n=1 Tax=Planktotalea sp. TaxID=2029877 RepID=UPI000EB925C1|nr:peptidoglycan -binding protein [Paracoccaceae bacterium]HCW82511.1 peptidoglycan-binding protein [Paracoccaceae bacterium]